MRIQETYHTFFAKVCLVIVCYGFLYFSYLALISPISRGDSTGYHIPIAESILDGSFLNPTTPSYGVNPVKFYPGSSEAILSVFMLLHIPLNLFNILALFSLFVSCFLLGKQFFHERPLAVIFASTVVTLPIMTQWVITQFVDYWFAVFFVLLLFLLQKPEKTVKYALFLGVCSGFLIGTKYSGPFVLAILLGVYYKRILAVFSVRFVFIFSCMTFLCGGFWYLRNVLFTGNPYFPQNLFTPDKDFLRFKVFDAIINHPTLMFDAILNQYAAWTFAVGIVPLLLIFVWKRLNRQYQDTLLKLLFMVIGSGIVFAILPSEPGSYTHYISSYRYSLTAFIPLILMAFLLGVTFKKYVFLYLFVFITMLSIPQISFHPKLVFFLVPVAYIIAVYPKGIGRYIKKYV